MGQEYPLSGRARNYSEQRTGIAYSAVLFGRAFQRIALGSAFLFLLGWTQPKANAQVTILHSFGDGSVPHDGTDPQCGLIQAPDGNFYGVTYSNVAVGGRAQGVAFQMTTGGTVTVIKSFAKGISLSNPLLYADGKLIGIANGALGGNASLFALTESAKDTWSIKTWYKFKYSLTDPSVPAGSLIVGANDDLYGVTEDGGSNKGGTAYTVDPKTHAFTVIANFDGPAPDDSPTSTLLLATDGNFYGGTWQGQIFEMTPDGTVSPFYTFSSNVDRLTAPLIEGTDGNFYGTAGSFVFQLTPDATLTVLHTFGQGTDGKGPAGAVAQGPNGNLYGLCTVGGTAGDGTIYEISTDGSSYTVLHNFGDGSITNDGQNPAGGLLLGADNNFYGVTEFGGSADTGTIFKVSP
jgi:uncharacterized repeat protein (TIGR03803 family)